MKRGARFAIIGDGRIGRAIAYYLKRNDPSCRVSYLVKEGAARSCDILIGALPGWLGERCLQVALRYKKHLIDVSDVDPPYYLEQTDAISNSGITVVPGCGFSPGLVDLITGQALSEIPGIGSIEIMAGTLSPEPWYYPFLWCFEDIVLGHSIPSWQMLAGRKTKCMPFAGYREEEIFRIRAESYYCASGFENVLFGSGIPDFAYRVVRPRGFRTFFSFLRAQGFLGKETSSVTKKIVESTRRDNITFSRIAVNARNTRMLAIVSARSRGDEPMNSMQKATASVPAACAPLLAGGALKGRGLVFMHDLCAERGFLRALFTRVRAQGVRIVHTRECVC
jgi:saccharopine dehydrogenase-like NADP-dependent oxidoreductase